MYQPVTEDELNAYADGLLDGGRQLAVEAYLRIHPDAAIDLFHHLRQKEEIRLWLAERGAPPAVATASLAERFGRIIWFRQNWHGMRRSVAAVALILLGWLAHGLVTPSQINPHMSPEAVLADDADQAWHVTQLTQPEHGTEHESGRTPVPGEPDLLPAAVLPKGMRRVASDEIPWDGGKAVVELMATSHGEQLVLLKAATKAADSDLPSIQVQEGVTTVAWRDDGYAYALSGEVPAQELLGLVHLLANRS